MTAPTWTQRPVNARDLCAGDVLADQRGQLWSVSSAHLDRDGAVQVEIVRGGQRRTPAWSPTKPIPTLLTADDARALDLLVSELGAETVRRDVA